MNKLLMIADDLTGACDAGIQFAAGGFASVVLFDQAGTHARKADAVIFDTASRAMMPKKAYEAVRGYLTDLNAAEFDVLYKKMDSTLRGNIGSELDAIMDQFGIRFAVVAPALPALNRVTKKGVHYWNGVEIAETEMGRDPKTSVTESDIVKLLSAQSKRTAGLIDQSILYADESVFKEKVAHLIDEGCTLFVCDAETAEDLKQIVSRFSDWGSPLIWTGSAGLAECLVSGEEKRAEEFVLKPAGPVLLLCGSRSALTKKQTDHVKMEFGAASVTIQPDQLLDPTKRETEIARCIKDLKRFFKNGMDAVLDVGDTAVKEIDLLPSLIEEALGFAAAEVIRSCQLKRIILTGGDTAKAVARQLGAKGMELIQEIEPGIPLARMLGTPDLTVVTKAGAFGGPHSLGHALTLLKGQMK